MKRIQAAKLVRLQILSYLDENPVATIDEARATISSELKDEFGASAWLELLLKLLVELLPLIFEAKKERSGLPGV